MNVTPKGEPKVVISYEGSVNHMPWWLALTMELYIGCLVWSVILHKPEWVKWLLSWLPYL